MTDDDTTLPPPTSAVPIAEETDANLEDAFQGLFKTSASGGGEEELLRIAADYSLQLTAPQIKALLYLEWCIPKLSDSEKMKVRHFIDRWLQLKRNNNSDMFVMKALDFISLRRFINENSMKVNIER